MTKCDKWEGSKIGIFSDILFEWPLKQLLITGIMKKVQLQKVIYDQTKGGVDLLDLLSRCLSIRIKSQQWSINSLTGLRDTACTNAHVI